MPTFTLRLPPATYECVRELAKHEDRSMQMWIQRVLDEHIPEGMKAAIVLRELRKRKKAKLG